MNPLTQTTYDANSNKERVTDAAGTVTFTDYDQWNRPRRVVAAEGTAEAVETTTTYDVGGNALHLTLVNKVAGVTRPQRTDYVYDAFDRKTQETLPAVADGLARITRWTYDRQGKVLTSTDPKGQRVETTYDRAGRAVAVSLRQAPPFAGTPDERRTFVYDAAGNLLSVTTENPRAITLHTCTYVYDALNRVTSETQAFTGQATSTVTCGYDLAGNRTLCTYPVASGSVTGGRRVESIYDLANRVTTITDKGRTGAQATTYAYDLNGNRKTCTVPSGVVSTYDYDALNRNTVATTTRPTTPTATQVYRVAYFYDAVANRVAADEILEGQPNRTLTWRYDRQYRLTSEKAVLPATSTDTTWTYDLAGNRLTQVVVTAPTVTTTTTTYVYDDLNQLLSFSAPSFARTYTYDLNGNRTVQTTNGGLTHVSTYDVINRLTQVASKSSPTATSSNVLFSAAYDYRTRRLTTKEGSTTTYFRYDGGDSFQEVRGGTSPAIQVEHLRGSGMGGGIGSILYSDRSKVSGPEETFVYAPNVGHVVALVSSAGALVKTDRYDAFGNVTASTGTSANNRLANTKERTASIGLDIHGFRYYDPVIGRYTGRDPIAYGDGPNVYIYVHADPVNHVDPLGLGTEDGKERPPPPPIKEGQIVFWQPGRGWVVRPSDHSKGWAGTEVIPGQRTETTVYKSWTVSGGLSGAHATPEGAQHAGEIANARGKLEFGAEVAGLGLLPPGASTLGGAAARRGLAHLDDAARAAAHADEAAAAAKAAAREAAEGGAGKGGRQTLTDKIADHLTHGVCFIAGTKVLTDQGPVAIELIVPGMFVWSWCEADGHFAFKKVIQTYATRTSELVYVSSNVSNGTQLIGTPTHPFLVLRAESMAWIPMGELRIGDRLLLEDASTLEIGRISSAYVGSIATYNLQVDDYHTYFVAISNKNYICVHNTGKPVLRQMQAQRGLGHGHSIRPKTLTGAGLARATMTRLRRHFGALECLGRISR